jgi:hypothetical protein
MRSRLLNQEFNVMIKSSFLLALLLLCPMVFAQNTQPAVHDQHNQPPDQDGSTLTWEQLTDLIIETETPAALQTVLHVKFPETLKARDGQNVRIKGFMYPLKTGETHDYFLLSALPPSCPFCLPGGSMTLIEVKCAEPVEYTMEPILLEGTFSLLEDDPSGLYYRITEAKTLN